MPDYTAIVDDSVGQIVYEPGGASWSSVGNSTHAYQGTLHNAMSQDANLTFNFVGGRELVISGNFNGDNGPSDSATYPFFQVDTQNLNCLPNPPQNGGQFLCSTSLPSEISNHTLSMFMNPNAATQQFHIDYIRHGSSSQAAQAANGTVMNVQSPDNSTPGLSFHGQWENSKSLGSASDIGSAMRTSTPASTAIYHFLGDSFAWWSCCMPPGTSNNAANATYSIDGGDVISLEIGGEFMQGAQCKDERILFQTQPGQLQAGNHTVEVVYDGDDTKMPLTLCALAAVPLDFSALDVQPSNSGPHLSSITPSSTRSFSSTPSPSRLNGNNVDQGLNQSSTTSMIVGIISGLVIAAVILFVSIIWRWRKRAKQRAQERRSSSTDSLFPFVFHPVVGFIDMEKRSSVFVPYSSAAVSASSLHTPITAPSDMSAAPPVGHEQDEYNRPRSTEIHSDSSPLESRPPSYRTTRSLLNS